MAHHEHPVDLGGLVQEALAQVQLGLLLGPHDRGHVLVGPERLATTVRRLRARPVAREILRAAGLAQRHVGRRSARARDGFPPERGRPALAFPHLHDEAHHRAQIVEALPRDLVARRALDDRAAELGGRGEVAQPDVHLAEVDLADRAGGQRRSGGAVLRFLGVRRLDQPIHRGDGLGEHGELGPCHRETLQLHQGFLELALLQHRRGSTRRGSHRRREIHGRLGPPRGLKIATEHQHSQIVGSLDDALVVGQVPGEDPVLRQRGGQPPHPDEILGAAKPRIRVGRDLEGQDAHQQLAAARCVRRVAPQGQDALVDDPRLVQEASLDERLRQILVEVVDRRRPGRQRVLVALEQEGARP